MSPKSALLTVLLTVLTLDAALAARLHVTPIKTLPSVLRPLPASTGGRVQNFTYQWPGIYFEATFSGTAVFFNVGPGDAILHVRVDDKPIEKF